MEAGAYLKLNFIAGIITKEVTFSSTPPPPPTSSSQQQQHYQQIQ